MYRLKANQPDFEVVDGKFAGRKFKAGELYEEIPQAEAAKFEKLPQAPAAEPPSAPAPDIEAADKGGKKK